jgi:outer membrane protein OmpA-like peptidoglycan-associated protein
MQRLFFVSAWAFVAVVMSLAAQDYTSKNRQTTSMTVESADKALKLYIQNVDITKFPDISLIVEAMTVDTSALMALDPQKLTVMENGKPKKVLSVRKISVEKRIPVDFVFVVDITATMQSYIDAVRTNAERFAKNLLEKGIDYRLGLVMYSDSIDAVMQPTSDVQEFVRKLSSIQARGGKDEKENALEALAAAMRLNFRPSANKITLLVTDAPYHQRGEEGDGQTEFTTRSIIDSLNKREMRVIPIAPERVTSYNTIANATRGRVFDISTPFDRVLDLYARGLSNLYAITYKTDEPAIPDSVNVALVNDRKQELVRKTIPILEIGRKIIIEDLLFAYNKAVLMNTFLPQLDKIAEFMNNKKNVIIRIEGHTDATGSAEINLRLSLQRAEAVKGFLVQKRIAAHRIQTIGFGKTRPIASNESEFGRRLNRRTEVVIVEK